jgi:predicted ATPase/class 3 adenylate cyclase
MPTLPSGTVTFLFTDIEGSTQLLERLGDRYAGVLAVHQRLVRDAVASHDGHEIDTQGDAFFVAFRSAKDALNAAIAAQRGLTAEPWPDGAAIRVRMGLHTGEPLLVEHTYVGMDVHRAARVCAAGHGGQVLLTHATYALLGAVLRDSVQLLDLGEHRLKDLTRPERLYQATAAGLPSDFPPLRSLDVLPNNLPIQLTSFIGREQEVRELSSRLRTARLLTLTGAGGIGKTRLAIQVAAEVLAGFRDGVWLVELASIADPALVPPAVAAILGVREQLGRPLADTLSDYLRPRAALLVLDNCEHLVDACAQLAQTLLVVCPHVKIVATSREALGVPGESVRPVPPLSLPEDSRDLHIESLSQYESIQLFVERAVGVFPSFRLTPRNAQAMVHICARLDGIPLAIEMAAARLKALSVEQIAGRLDDAFRLLTAGSRTALPRHQTLRATLDWSYNLLDGDERQLLNRLSVFAGGFTLDAAEAVCEDRDGAAASVLDLLPRLVEKSLVVADRQEERVRYRLLEPIRQYAREKLAGTGEDAAIEQRHLGFFLLSVDDAASGLSRPFDQWLEHSEQEFDNIRTALDRALGGRDVRRGTSLAAAVWRFWLHRGSLSEGRIVLNRALAATEASGVPPLLRMKALNALAYMALTQDDYEEVASLCRQSLALAGTTGEERETAIALAVLGHTLWHMGDATEAVRLCEQSLALARRSAGTRALAVAVREFGYVVWHLEDYARLEPLAGEYLRLAGDLGDSSAKADALLLLGRTALHHGDYTRASSLYEESLALSRAQRDKVAAVRAMVSLADVATLRGMPAQAETLYREGLVVAVELGDRWWLARCIEGMAVFEASRASFARVATLLGAAAELRATLGSQHPPATQEGTMSQAREKLGDREFHHAWTRGRAMTDDDLVAFALERSPSG